MKLTPKLIENADSVINPEKQLTLQLRSQQISYIENLEYVGDEYTVLDLTDNDITDFGGIPSQKNIEVVLLARNSIKTVSQGHCNIRSLSMMYNNIESFRELSKMRSLVELSTLLMVGNPITKEHHYRLFTIWLFPRLSVLDCQKVKASERASAEDLLGKNYESRSPAADALLGSEPKPKSAASEPELTKASKMLTAEDKAKLVAELEQASTMEDIERISKILKDGSTE